MNKRNSSPGSASRMFGAFSLVLMIAFSVVPSPVSKPFMLNPIDCPGTDFTIALGINARSEIVGNCRTSNDRKFHGFLLSGGSLMMIDFPGAAITAAHDINDGGEICGSYNTES